jgi:hypothetical protein
LPSADRVIPCETMLPCQIAWGWVGSLTSIAVIEGVAVAVA